MNCAACGPRNIVSPVQDLGGWIVPTVLDQKVFEFLFETHARIFFEYLLNHLRRHLIEAETQEIESRTEMNQGYFAREPRGNSGRCMQRDRLPNHIGALWRHLMLYAEIASGIGAVHLKPVVAAIGRDQTQIVQDSPQNAASSSTTERPIPLTAMYPKIYVRRQCEQRNAGEQDCSRSTAAVHKAVSGILTPATDSTRAKVIAFSIPQSLKPAP